MRAKHLGETRMTMNEMLTEASISNGFGFQVKNDVKTPVSDWEKLERERIVGASAREGREAVDYIGRYRIVVVTLCSVGKLVNAGIPRVVNGRVIRFDNYSYDSSPRQKEWTHLITRSHLVTLLI